MNPNRTFKILLGATNLGVALACQSQSGDSAGKDKMMRMGAMILESEGPVAFYGKVVDQFGAPVEGVEIKLHLRRHSPNPQALFMAVDEYRLKTNRNGEFNFKGNRGLDCGVYGFKKHGYEYDRRRTMAEYEKIIQENPQSRTEAPDSADFKHGMKPRASNPSTPSLFYLRKLGETTHVLQRDAVFAFKPEQANSEKGYDFIVDVPIDEKRFNTMLFNDEPIVCDLKVKATQDPKTRAWSVLLSSGTPGGGVLATEPFLYEAPQEGYQPSLSLGVDPKAPKIRCLFIRSRNPYIYTRIDLGGDFGDKGAPFIRSARDAQDRFVFGGSAIVNPYGERILEEDKELPSEVTARLENEIRASFRFNPNGRPPKPDLPRLVKEWEKNRPLTEKLKGMFKR